MATTVEIVCADDTNGRMVTFSGWANIASGTYNDNPDSAPAILGIGNADWGGGTLVSVNAFLRFNTGATLPDNAIIISAALKIVQIDRLGTEPYAADFYDYGGSPSTSADWAVSAAGTAIASFNVLTEDVVNTIPLTGLSGISTTGYTGLRLASPNPATPTTDNYMDFAALEDATFQEPRLEVTYILPGDCRAADIFDRGNEDLLTDGWAAFADWDEMQILSNTVWGGDDPSGSIYTAVTLDDDQWASTEVLTLTGTANNVGIGLMLRASDSAEDCYTCVVNLDGDVSVGKYIAGSYTSLQVWAFPAFGGGDELRFEAEGTTLRVYNDLVLVGEVTDSSLTGGYPGLCLLGTTGTNVGGFFAGNLDSSPSIVGIHEALSLYATGSGTIIVPPDAEFAVAMYSHWDPTPDTIDYVRLDGEDFTPRQLQPPTGSDSGAGILTLSTMPAPGPYTLTWGWLAGANQDEGGRIYVVFLKDLHATSPFRDVGTDGNDGINTVTVSLATAPGDFVLGMTQKYASNPVPKAYPLIDGVVYNGEHFDVGITAPSSGVSTSIPSGAANYNTQAFISFPAQSQEEDVLTLPIANLNDDGTGVYERAGGGWPPSTGTWTDSSGTTLEIMKYDKAGVDSGESKGEVSFLRFDTSSLPDDATIESALLRMYVTAKTDANNTSVVGDYYDFGGEPTVAADWIETASPSIFSAVDLGAITVGAVNDFVLTDLSGINLTGYTGIRLTLSSYTVVYNHDLAQFAAFEHTLFQEPRLFVTYTVEGEGEEFPLMWFTAIV